MAGRLADAPSITPTVTDALRRFVGDYRSAHRPAPWADRVLDWLCACRTRALGGHLLSCDWSAPAYNSCGNRHCPQCRGAARADWLLARRRQLLPVPHFQVVFTLPAALRSLARHNPAPVYGALFRAANLTLQQLATDRMAAQLGLIAVLHSWTNDLRYHPHLHVLVTAGGLDNDLGRWVPTRPQFLFPTRVMAALFRGKFLAELRAAFDDGNLWLPGDASSHQAQFDATLRRAYRHRWVIHVEPPDGRPADAAAGYLARYVVGNAISNHRILAIGTDEVSLQTRRGPVSITGVEFVRRFVQHVLPPRQHRVRYFGLYAHGNLHTRWTRAWQVLDGPLDLEEPPTAVHRPTCPVCGGTPSVGSIPGLPRCRPTRPPRARGPPW